MSGGDVWDVGDAYEAYVGRWSRLVAAEFVRELGMPGGLRWLDVGRGTGALSAAIDGDVVGVDRSLGFIRHARNVVNADGTALPFKPAGFDVVVSGVTGQSIRGRSPARPYSAAVPISACPVKAC